MAKPNRHTPPAGPESEAQPGSRGRILRNLLGITHVREMAQAEYDALLLTRERSIARVDPDARFDAAFVCELHRDWLKGIYEWAGRFRTVDVAKGGFRWPPAHLVASNMAAFERETLAAHTPCPPAPLDVVARQLAIVHAEFLIIHPFREGNGRTARWLADLMAAQAGYPFPEYRLSGPQATLRGTRYIAAVQRGYLKQYDQLIDLFAEALRRALARG